MSIDGSQLIRTTRMVDGVRWKFWKPSTFCCSKAVFLGFRTLHNGPTFYEGDDCWVFCPKETFRAALVSFSEKHNPVYVTTESVRMEKSMVCKYCNDGDGNSVYHHYGVAPHHNGKLPSLMFRAIQRPSVTDTWFSWYPVRYGSMSTGSWVWLKKVWRNRCCGTAIYQPLSMIDGPVHSQPGEGDSS